jgi:hypothetical protein
VGLALAFIFPIFMCLIAGIIAGMVAKRAKVGDALAAAYPATGAMAIAED